MEVEGKATAVGMIVKDALSVSLEVEAVSVDTMLLLKNCVVTWLVGFEMEQLKDRMIFAHVASTDE